MDGPDTLPCRQNLPPRGLPGRAKPTIGSPPATKTASPRAEVHGDSHKALILRLYLFLSPKRSSEPWPRRPRRSRRFRSLRLSVRTPPFHGGESGSIPLGSANNINGLSHFKYRMSNR